MHGKVSVRYGKVPILYGEVPVLYGKAPVLFGKGPILFGYIPCITLRTFDPAPACDDGVIYAQDVLSIRPVQPMVAWAGKSAPFAVKVETICRVYGWKTRRASGRLSTVTLTAQNRDHDRKRIKLRTSCYDLKPRRQGLVSSRMKRIHRATGMRGTSSIIAGPARMITKTIIFKRRNKNDPPGALPIGR